jgi:uncharacterized membrane protein YphA (DoxX/SURF4 family)
MQSIQRILTTSAPDSVLLIRLIVGVIFSSEGIQKLLDSHTAKEWVLGHG